MEKKKGVLIEHKKESYVKEKTTYLTIQRAYHNDVMKSSILIIREFYVLQGYPLQRAYHNEVMMKSSILSVICSSPITLSFLYDFC